MRLYVGNLPFCVSEEELQGWLAQAGLRVAEVQLIRDQKSGRPRGFGFLEVNSERSLEEVRQALRGRQLLGRQLVVNPAHPRPGPKRVHRRWPAQESERRLQKKAV